MPSPIPYLTYITAAGDRWDLLSWRYYGDPLNYGPIVMANPAVRIEAVLAAGITIRIPILAASSAIASALPPWKLAQQ